MAFAGTHYRGQHINGFVVVLFQNQLQHLFLGILNHLLSAQIRIGLSRPSVKQTEIIVHFGLGANRRAGILVRGFLFYGNHRTQSRYLIHVGAFSIAQKIAGVGRESFNITTLPFGKNSIKSQRGFTAAT